MTFAEAWATRVEAEFEAKPLYVIGRAALLRNKRAAALEMDLLDVALLERNAAPIRKPVKRVERAKTRSASPTRRRRRPR